ncbi:hypothetical protein MUN82_20985 [Hymenobacter aerilatus]|uniref:Uncharacterized protein n=1 Tax=Hymenobacter aerilatus TaxID=2932251 RepID=A0A8T9STC0_9BACT|nr:hypothetical protein [Hymenobacter aerilatus]UOR05388.1 hypothetical protein MUN82_20985 [Hymenobacter aerilatus]
MIQEWKAEQWNPEEILGAKGKLRFAHIPKGLTIVLPTQKPNAIAYALKIA